MIIKDIKAAKQLFRKCKIKATPTIIITSETYAEVTKEINALEHPEKVRTAVGPERWYGMIVKVSDELPCAYILK